MKRTFISIILLALLFSACDNHEEMATNSAEADLQTTSTDTILSRDEVDNKILSSIQESDNFNWNNASDQMIFSALSYCNHILTIGYSTANGLKNNSIGESKQSILNAIIDIESNGSTLKSTDDILVYDNENLVLMDVVIKDIQTIGEIREMENIRYIEPAGYSLQEQGTDMKSADGYGCSFTNDSIYQEDYTVYAPGCLVPWNFFKHNIPNAWAYSTGSGITVGLIDTGVSSEQSVLCSSFNNGYSSDRSISKYGVYIDSSWPWDTITDGPYDLCGHGTCMSSVMSAPRNNLNKPVGVAYNCNLVAYRATHDVLLDSYHEQTGVAQALTELAENSSVKIISMSLGHIFTINKISDAITYAYEQGKLIIAAGGTSTWFTSDWVDVIFPASMSETVAVTGITDSETYTECTICHKGAKIDFTVVMQHESDEERTTLVNGLYEDYLNYCGGSSISTAMTAGIAALVWSLHPEWSREEVLEKLIQSTDLYPDKSSEYGYGCIDALVAVQ